MSRHPTHHRFTAARSPHFILHPMVLTTHLLVAGSIAASAGWISHAHAQQTAPTSESQAGEPSLTAIKLREADLKTMFFLSFMEVQ